MLTTLGRLVIRRPRLLIAVVIITTLVLASFLPTLQFKTNFADFAPDDPLTRANNRIQTDFGSTQHILFLRITTTDHQRILAPDILRQQDILEHILSASDPDINSSVGIADLINAAAQLDYNQTIDNLTDNQVTTILDDLFTPPPTTPVTLLTTTDPNEPKVTDPLDITSTTLSRNNTILTITFHVYNLQSLPTTLHPPTTHASLAEWYLDFTNHFTSAGITLHYQLSARLEPTTPRWIIGNGLLTNLKLHDQARAHTYTTAAYLWVTIPDQSIAFPVKLHNATVTIDRIHNTINLTVTRAELRQYGIAPTYSGFILPAHFTNFSAGTRTYTAALIPRNNGPISINTTKLLTTLNNLEHRRLLSRLITRVLARAGIQASTLDTLTNSSNHFSLPATISGADLQNRWTTLDTAPDTGNSSLVYPLLPPIFANLNAGIQSFLPSTNQSVNATTDTILLVFLPPTSDSTLVEKMTTKVRDIIQSNSNRYPSLSITVTGPDVVSTEVNKVAMDANMIISPLIFVLIVIILFIAFRKPSFVFQPIIVFVISTLWLFGTMALLRISFNIIAVAIVPLNIGLGVEYSVNLLYNYRIEREKGNSAASAVFLSIKEVGTAIFLAWATTFVAFISFLSARIPPIRTFGLFLALGISYTFIISMTFLMAARYTTDRTKSYQKTQRESLFSIQTQLRRLAVFLLHHDKAVFMVALLVSAFMVLGITQLKTGFSESQFIPPDNKALQELTSISDQFPFASQDQSFILIEGNVATRSTLQGIAETQQRLADDRYVTRTPTGGPKTTNIYSIMQKALSDNSSLRQQFHIDANNLPRNDTDVKAFYDYLYESLKYYIDTQSVLNRNGDTYNATVIRVFVSLPSASDMNVVYKAHEDELKADLADYGFAKATITGYDLITYSIVSSLTESQLLSTGVCFILATIMLIGIYRRPTLGLVAMIPVSLSMIWVLGTMYFIGYTLNVLTVTVTSITIGVGIDYAVYITERFRLVVDRTGDIDQAAIEAISRTGSGVSIAAASSIFGFGVLLFAPIPPEQQFGLITALTLLYAIATSIFILPLVLTRWAHWRKKRVGYVISPGPPKEN